VTTLTSSESEFTVSQKLDLSVSRSKAVFSSAIGAMSSAMGGTLVEQAGSNWTATDLRTGVFGVGTDKESALEDLRVALDEHLDMLERQPELSQGLRAQLEYLRQLKSSGS
jgi:hypothetical protein